MNLLGDWIVHLMPILLMLIMVGSNHLIVHYRTEQRYALETSRLRVAIISELLALKEVYRKNLELIENNEKYLMSTRSPVLVYKGNLGRLTSLFESSVIENLVSLFAKNEIVEGVLAAHAIGKGGVSYQLTPETKLDDLKKLYSEGIMHVEWTCNALCREDADCYSEKETRLAKPRQGPVRSPSINRLPISVAGTPVS